MFLTRPYILDTISKMELNRDDFKNLRVIFCGGTMLGQETFSNLRNLCENNLVIQNGNLVYIFGSFE